MQKKTSDELNKLILVLYRDNLSWPTVSRLTGLSESVIKKVVYGTPKDVRGGGRRSGPQPEEKPTTKGVKLRQIRALFLHGQPLAYIQSLTGCSAETIALHTADLKKRQDDDAKAKAAQNCSRQPKIQPIYKSGLRPLTKFELMTGRRQSLITRPVQEKANDSL